MDLAYLSQEGPDGMSVKSHLTELIHKLLLAKDPDALATLESLSLEVKAAHFDAAAGAMPAGAKKPKASLPPGMIVPATHETIVPTEPWCKSAKALHKLEPESVPAPATVELPEQMPMFEWAGVGLAQEETYRLYLAMLALKKAHGLVAVRFFGKIFGTKADYVIVEGRAADPAVHVPPSKVGSTPAEAPGVGLNTFCYFVAPSAADEFVLLEDVTPEQVVASSGIRKYFTGELSATVKCYPAFPGPESAYLRAQIARIVAATMVWPLGKFGFDEESELEPKPIVDSPEYAVPDDLSTPDAWVHVYGKVLKNGRTTKVVKPPPAEGEEEEEEDPELEPGPALESIAGDAPVLSYEGVKSEPDKAEFPGELGAWTISSYNDKIAKYGVAVAKSNAWPGAYAAIAKSGDKTACLYLGYGHEAKPVAFTPSAPPKIATEAEEAEDVDEPALADENAILKEIDEAKNIANNTEGEAAEE
jgi:radial spoke head protein 4A